jgi:hypothetical protein
MIASLPITIPSTSSNYTVYLNCSNMSTGFNPATPYWLLMPKPALSLAEGYLRDMAGLNVDWEAVGSEPPNETARQLALTVLDRTCLMGRVRPTSVTASAEGGVAIIFKHTVREAGIECLNDGTLWLLWYDQNDVPRSREVQSIPAGMDAALDLIRSLHPDA